MNIDDPKQFGKFVCLILTVFIIMTLRSFAQTQGSTRGQTPTTFQNNGGGYPGTYQQITGFYYSYTALDGNTPVMQIVTGPYTVYETLTFSAALTPSAGPGKGVAHLVEQVPANDAGPIMGGQQIGKASNGTFTDFVGLKGPDGVCTAWEKANNVSLKNGTTILIVYQAAGHSFTLHSTDPDNANEYPLKGSFLQKMGYAFIKVNGAWVLDPSYKQNPVLLKTDNNPVNN